MVIATQITTAKLAEITGEAYTALGISAATDDRTDELIASELADAGIEIDEDSEPDWSTCEYTRQAVSRALEAWAAEGNEAAH
jgi:hypothetical protein